MGKSRLEAFSDGVIAIIITIMVLEMKAPEKGELQDLVKLLPVFLSYILSFVYVAIYWVNHHHFIHAIHKVSGGLLWANMLLLFCLSLVPFTTAWMGENEFVTWPVFVYGINLLACAAAYQLLTIVAIHLHGPDSEIARAVGSDLKGKVSLVSYVAALILAFKVPFIAIGLFTFVAVMWMVPDKRIERELESGKD